MVNNKPYTLNEGQIGFAELRQAIKDKNWSVVPNLVSPKAVVATYTNGRNVSIVDGVILYKGVPVGEGISKRIFAMKEEGFAVSYTHLTLPTILLV